MKWPTFNYDSCNSAQLIEWAEKQGHTVVRGGERLLLLDIDKREDYTRMYGLLLAWNNGGQLALEDVRVYPSSSGNRHVEVSTISKYPVGERIAMQLVLGSDRTRERLSLERVWAGDPIPSLFVRPAGVEPIAKDWDEFRALGPMEMYPETTEDVAAADEPRGNQDSNHTPPKGVGGGPGKRGTTKHAKPRRKNVQRSSGR